MTSAQLLACFERWRDTGEAMVLATVYATEGSTYSKAGAYMLINAEGDFQGMLSGGCLEGDLAERARMAVETGNPASVTYDLGQDDEELWGLGVGCDGLMRIFLLPIVERNDYQPFKSIAAALAGDRPEAAALVVESDVELLPVGATLVTAKDAPLWSDLDARWRQQIEERAQAVSAAGTTTFETIEAEGAVAEILYAVLRPPPRILILGAGLDARPVIRYATELGWRLTVQDHRPAYIDKGGFDDAEQVLCVAPEQLAKCVDLAAFDAAIVMSHHLASDREYLRQLADTSMPYVGLLGPPHRRERLVAELGDAGNQLGERLHGPAGIDIGGSGPASIALSIIAEMHAALSEATAKGLADQE